MKLKMISLALVIVMALTFCAVPVQADPEVTRDVTVFMSLWNDNTGKGGFVAEGYFSGVTFSGSPLSATVNLYAYSKSLYHRAVAKFGNTWTVIIPADYSLHYEWIYAPHGPWVLLFQVSLDYSYTSPLYLIITLLPPP